MFKSLALECAWHGEIEDLIRKTKAALLKTELVQQRVSVCRAILPQAEDVRANIRTRMKDPFES